MIRRPNRIMKSPKNMMMKPEMTAATGLKQKRFLQAIWFFGQYDHNETFLIPLFFRIRNSSGSVNRCFIKNIYFPKKRRQLAVCICVCCKDGWARKLCWRSWIRGDIFSLYISPFLNNRNAWFFFTVERKTMWQNVSSLFIELTILCNCHILYIGNMR